MVIVVASYVLIVNIVCVLSHLEAEKGSVQSSPALIQAIKQL